jgi:hypothetical protein
MPALDVNLTDELDRFVAKKVKDRSLLKRQ